MIPVALRHMVDREAVSLPSRESAPLIVVNHDYRRGRRVRYVIEGIRSCIHARSWTFQER
jgi:hypothetical protein